MFSLRTPDDITEQTNLRNVSQIKEIHEIGSNISEGNFFKENHSDY